MLGRMKTHTHRNLLLLACAAIVTLLLATASAASASRAYFGKTKSGTSVSFKLSGSRVSGLKTTVPAVCLESTGSYGSRSGVELFTPPGSFKLGRTLQVKDLQPAAMNRGIKATKTYTVSLRRSGNRVGGKLRVSFSFMTLGMTIYDSYIFFCTGSTSFSAIPR
jgi:hypothetical protein